MTARAHILDECIQYACANSTQSNSSGTGADFRQGRTCAAAALKSLGSKTLDVGTDKYGAPVWPAGTVGSITHTNGFVSAAAAWDRDIRSIGIDSETIEDESAAEAVRLTCFAGEDRFLTGNRVRNTEISLIVFSAKEAVYKCLYPLLKRSFTFEDIRVTDIDWNEEKFLWNGPGIEAAGSFRLDRGLVHSSVWLAQA